jgi:hypothetical protein
MAVTRAQAAAAVAEATAARDSIQANLLDLDGSFGKRMLAGATLSGESELRWESAAADLAVLWEIFNAYAAVVDESAELMSGAGRLSDRELALVTTWLTGASVELTRQGPIGRRGLTETGRSDLTLAAAVQEMKRGLLDAYQAKAARLGAAEDTELSKLYAQAHDLLWTALRDLATAAVR